MRHRQLQEDEEDPQPPQDEDPRPRTLPQEEDPRPRALLQEEDPLPGALPQEEDWRTEGLTAAAGGPGPCIEAQVIETEAVEQTF